jgi:hypothetical protein
VDEYESQVANLGGELARSREIEGWHLDHLNTLQDVLKEKEDELIEKDVRDAMNQMLLDVCTAAEVEHKEAKAEAEVVAEEKEKEFKKKKLQLDTWGNSHAFTMMRLNDPEARLPLYAIRCKRSAMKDAIIKRRKKHPNSVLIYQNINVPNPVNMYNRLKASGVLNFKRNYCVSPLTEAELITKLGDLYDIVK